jgi:ribosomal protein S18 acetylase RimI-like enzyme
MHYSFRPATAADEPFLWEMLYQAIYIPAGEPLPPRTIVHDPKLAHYVTGWGTQAGDLGVLACIATSGEPVGAAWLRLFPAADPGWGFVDAETPELSMALLSDHRGRGLGKRLLHALLQEAQAQYAAISLSIDPRNVAALRLYQQFGFVVVGESGTSWTMRLAFANRAASD